MKSACFHSRQIHRRGCRFPHAAEKRESIEREFTKERRRGEGDNDEDDDDERSRLKMMMMMRAK